MPPWLVNGGFVPYELFDDNGRLITVKDIELPPEPGYEPPKFEQYSMTGKAFLSIADYKRMTRGLKAATNQMSRIVRTIKRRREKERRRRLLTGFQNGDNEHGKHEKGKAVKRE